MILVFIYVLYVVFVVNYDNQETAAKAKKAWMFNEMKDTSFKRMNRSEFLNLMDDENAYRQGINPSGEISGTSSVIYEGDEIKPADVMHFSIDSGLKAPTTSKDANIEKLTDELKETAWANAKHVVFKHIPTNVTKYKSKSFLEYLMSFVPLRRMTIPMTNSKEWNRNLDS